MLQEGGDLHPPKGIYPAVGLDLCLHWQARLRADGEERAEQKLQVRGKHRVGHFLEKAIFA